MSPTGFPQEILVLVIRHLRRNFEALSNLCLTSSEFIGEARDLLYSQIRIRKKGPKASRNHDSISIDVGKSDKLFMTLTTYNTSLAACLKSFAYLTDFPSDNEEYMDLVNRTFRSMVNLKRLVLFPEVITPGLFNGCAFRLESLFCPATRSLTQAAGQDEIRRFLSSQPDLESLFLDWDKDPLLPLTTCSNLKTLRGSQSLVISLLPGRSTVRHLEWIECRSGGGRHEPFRQLSAELSNITILALGGLRDRIPLRSLKLYLTSLRVLRLMGSARAWDKLERDIPLFPKLQVFVWSADGPRWLLSHLNLHIFGKDQQQQSAITAVWFTQMEALDKVYFRVGDKRPQKYAYWKRGEIEPTYVDHGEALVGNGLCSWYS